MELTQARTIVKNLAEGIDPITGEVFPPDSPYNHPSVIRALFTVHRYSQVPKTRMSIDERRQKNLELGRPRNTGLPWSEEDRSRVASGFQSQQTIGELASTLGRSRSAIHAELIKQGLVEPVAV
jgi:hypothetical protein